MKLWKIVGGVLMTATVAGCSSNAADVPTPAQGNQITADASQISGPAVRGSVNLRQRIALPPNAEVTVTLADVSLADAPARVLSQKVFRTDGKQPPYNFVLPYNPQDIQPNQRINLSAAIKIDGRLVFITDTLNEVVNNNAGTQKDLVLVPISADGAATVLSEKPKSVGASPL